MLVSVLVAVFLVLGVLLFRTLRSPSSMAAPTNQRGRAHNPYSEGGPSEADLKQMREYNAAHPGAEARSGHH